MRKNRAFEKSMRMLLDHEVTCNVSPQEFDKWMSAPTAIPDVSYNQVLSNPLLVAHEIVEIAEVKRMGIAITDDAILANPGRVYEAHLRAFEVELKLAQERHHSNHIKSRLDDIKNWIDDPLLPSRLKPRCRRLLVETRRAAGFSNRANLKSTEAQAV